MSLVAVVTCLQFLILHGPISVLAASGLYFGFKLFADNTQNTISITNYAMAIVLAFANVSFAFARGIEKEEKIKERVQYSGERFVHSGILFLIASVLKYFLLQQQVLQLAKESSLGAFSIALLSLLPPFLYFSSVIHSIAALRELNSVLYERKKPLEELNRFI